MAKLKISVLVNDPGWPRHFVTLTKSVLSGGIKGDEVALAGPSEVSVLLTSDAEQKRLNSQFRAMDKSTNVLSFPQLEAFEAPAGLIGDISLARETVFREAEEMGITTEAHFAHLLVHGFLHLLGYDHQEDDEADIMEKLETKLLHEMGIADPYA